VNGYTRMTPQAGLQISLEWLKYRNISPPADLISK
jgi:hypothetical protein